MNTSMDLPLSLPAECTVVFNAGDLRGVVLGEADIPALQQFFEANPLYFETVNGQSPRSDEARQEFDDLPPAGMPFSGRWLIGLVDAAGRLQGMASVLSDFLADGVWHVGLFIVDTRLHGRGMAAAAYHAMEAWMQAGGARWLRLGAVIGNRRAEHFWPKVGYRQVRLREGVQTGLRISTLRVFVKPLGDAGIDDYLQRVARDRPDSALR